MTATSYIETRAEQWRAAVDRLTDRFETPAVTTATLRQDIEQLVETAVRQSHNTWKPGDPCPDCGEDLITRWVSYPELTRHENGYTTFQDGSNGGTVYAWDCPSCETILTVSPASLLIPVAPGELPTNDGTNTFSSLTTALNERLPSTDWRHGTASSCCESHYIGEQPLDAYSVESTHGTFTQGHTGERVTTIDYWCESCGNPLRQNPAALLDVLTL